MDGHKSCYIFAAAPPGDIPPLPREDVTVIAADAGLLTLERLGLEPDLVVGDLDSLGRMPSVDCAVERHPVEKDDTDTGLAVKAGLKLHCDRFFIFGGMGGKRPDHMLANMQTLLYLASQRKVGFLTDGETAITALSGSSKAVFPENYRGNISIFCASGTAEGVTIRHLRYELSDATLTSTFPLAVSNSFLQSDQAPGGRGNSPKNAEISLGHGALWIFFDCTGKELAEYPTVSFE